MCIQLLFQQLSHWSISTTTNHKIWWRLYQPFAGTHPLSVSDGFTRLLLTPSGHIIPLWLHYQKLSLNILDSVLENYLFALLVTIYPCYLYLPAIQYTYNQAVKQIPLKLQTCLFVPSLPIMYTFFQSCFMPGIYSLCLSSIMVNDNGQKSRLKDTHSPCSINLLILHSTAHLNSPQYLCILYGWLTIQQHSYLEQLQSLHLATPSLCFRVVKISFYIIDFIFFLYWLQDSFPTVSKVTLPRFDKLKCEIACVVQETNP